MWWWEADQSGARCAPRNKRPGLRCARAWRWQLSAVTRYDPGSRQLSLGRYEASVTKRAAGPKPGSGVSILWFSLISLKRFACYSYICYKPCHAFLSLSHTSAHSRHSINVEYVGRCRGSFPDWGPRRKILAGSFQSTEHRAALPMCLDINFELLKELLSDVLLTQVIFFTFSAL